jgi:hypothetical protein
MIKTFVKNMENKLDKKMENKKIKIFEFIDKENLDNILFSKTETNKIKKILKQVLENLSGKFGLAYTGGGCSHLFFQMNDQNWIGFHSATNDITISEKFKNFNELEKNENWDKVTNKFLWQGSDLSVKLSLIVSDIKNKNFAEYCDNGILVKNKLIELA